MFPKPLYSLAAALLAAPMVHGHYIFSQLMVNGATVGGDYDYIRKNDNTYMPSFTADVINSENLRCNSGALNSPAKTADVKAGDEIGAKIWFNEVIEHPGPGMIYMSKAPGSVSDYKGDGDWFKVWESGPDNGPANVDTSWGTWQKDHMSFTLPKDIPDGEYLVRFEHVGIHENHVGKAQFYMECAQINVSGGGSGSPGPMVQIPGVYTAEDPAFTYSIWGGSDPGYTMPGPAVWTGGASSGGSSSASTGSSSAGSSSAGSSASSGSASTEAPESSESSSEEAEAPAASGSASTGASTGASTDASTGASTGASAGASTDASTGSASTGAEAPSASAPAASNGQWNAPSAGQWGAAPSDNSGAPVQSSQQGGASQGGWGNWGTASSGSTGVSTSTTADKQDCEVQYIGGSAARARRAVRA